VIKTVLLTMQINEEYVTLHRHKYVRSCISRNMHSAGKKYFTPLHWFFSTWRSFCSSIT